MNFNHYPANSTTVDQHSSPLFAFSIETIMRHAWLKNPCYPLSNCSEMPPQEMRSNDARNRCRHRGDEPPSSAPGSANNGKIFMNRLSPA